MKPKSSRPERTLRTRAEALLRKTPQEVAQMSLNDVQRLVHELQVHQIELSMQNEELRRVQMELETARDRYADLYDFAPTAYLTLGADGKINAANLAAGSLIGLDRVELIGENFTHYIAPTAQDEFYLYRRRVMDSNAKQTCELDLITTAGERRVVHLEGVAVGNHDKRRTQLRLSLSDLTEARREEEVRTALKTRLQLAMQAANIGLWDLDLVTRKTYLSPELKHQLGFADEELPSTFEAWEERLHPDDRKETLSRVQAIVEGRAPQYDAEYRLRHKDGTYRWIHAMGALLRDETGRATHCLGLHLDITERRRTETALRESEERLKQMAANIREVFWLASADMKEIFYISPAYEQIWGRTCESLYKNPRAWLDAVHPKDRPRVRAAFIQKRASSRAPNAEYRIVRPDGSIRWIWDTGAAVRDNTGRIYRFAGVARDVTERKQMEVERGRMASIVESSNDAIFSRDLDDLITTWNPAAERILGYTAEEIIGHSISLLIPPERTSEVQKLRRRALKGDRVENWESVRLARNGHRVPVSVTISAITESRGKPIGISTILRDVTRQKQNEDALVQSERQLAEFFDQSPVALLWVDAQQRIQRANRAALNLLGTSSEYCLGRNVTKFQADPEVVARMLGRLAAGETVQNQRVRLRVSDGSIKHGLFDANGLWEGNQLVRTQWFVRDITKRVHLERELLEISEREQQRFAQDLHDDLGQHLSAMVHLTSSLEDELAAQKRPERAQADRILKLLNVALTRTRGLARGLHPVPAEPNGLMVALQELATQTRSLFGCDCRFLCPRPVLMKDSAAATHLYRIAQEAVTNSVKHGRAKRIRIGLARTPARVTVAVRDSGVGLPARRSETKGMGLRIMQYRAGMIGGSLVIQRAPKGGTSVVCTIHRPADNP